MVVYSGNKKAGFTLAEVLVTLGIIGVVAAMTIPTLMMNYQKQVWEAKLKKVYSVATNACERMLIEENVSAVNETEVYGSISDDTLKKYFKLMSAGSTVSGRGFSILLPDSAILYISVPTSYNGFNFFTDVNGLGGKPNDSGRDLFEFRLDKDCAYDSELGSNASDAAKAFKEVVENDWKIPDSYVYSNAGGSGD